MEELGSWGLGQIMTRKEEDFTKYENDGRIKKLS